jgi:type II secretory pathway component PulK
VGDTLQVLVMEGTRSLAVLKVRPVAGWVRRRIVDYRQANHSAQSAILEVHSSVDGRLQALYLMVRSKDPRQLVVFAAVGAVRQLEEP